MSESVAMMFYIAQKYGPTDTLPPGLAAAYRPE
jgi:hypothetical protein